MTRKKGAKPVGELNKRLSSEECFGESQDDNFYFIVGYTSGGAPYGITWEQAIADGLTEADNEDE